MADDGRRTTVDRPTTELLGQAPENRCNKQKPAAGQNGGSGCCGEALKALAKSPLVKHMHQLFMIATKIDLISSVNHERDQTKCISCT
mmetsp:Transcript_88629/g.162275  ORF Transcript_88629/g.162275 Transcript_88629/m.162275 type:complete len:88 (+) Transcript_88629:311-574(+)